MKFGPVPLAQAEGAVLAHSVQAEGTRWRKGLVLDRGALAALRAAGITQVTVARLEPSDVAEDAAAEQIVRALQRGAQGTRTGAALTGRVNLHAAHAGVFRVNAAAVNALNAVDPGITLATLPDYTRVPEGMMLATAKIIPYAVPGDALERACAALPEGAVSVAPVQLRDAALIMTRTPGFAQKLLDKGEAVLRQRVEALGLRLSHVQTVAHETAAVAEALRAARAPMVLVLGASATSDAGDVCPAGLIAAGGRLERFGMPVDPGNLLFLGKLGAAHVIGLPGCARSPALNGADWVLERLVCGLEVGDAEIAAMGVGGLLKEIPLRPQPRAIKPVAPEGPQVAIILLAAGSARRMRGTDKLLEPVGGEALLRRSARAALGSGAQAVHVVLSPGAEARCAALDGLAVDIVEAEAAAEGMGASLRAGIAALDPHCDAVIVALADMPDVGPAAYDRLIAAFDPEHGHDIARAVTEAGVPGHPVLFGRRFFESLADLGGDRGARDVLRAGEGFVVDVPLPGQAAVTDLDTPEQWAAYRRREPVGAG